METRKTWVSTAILGILYITFWKTLAVLLPTPGSLTNFSNSGSLNILNIEDTMKLYDVYFKEIDKIIKKYQKNIYLLKYEDIILKPDSVLKDIFNFCDLNSSDIKLPELINKDRTYIYKSEKVKFNFEKYALKLKEYGYSYENWNLQKTSRNKNNI